MAGRPAYVGQREGLDQFETPAVVRDDDLPERLLPGCVVGESCRSADEERTRRSRGRVGFIGDDDTHRTISAEPTNVQAGFGQREFRIVDTGRSHGESKVSRERHRYSPDVDTVWRSDNEA